MSYTFIVPKRLNGNKIGFEALADFANQTNAHQYSEIVIDFKDCIFIQGNLCAIIGSIIKELQSRNNSVRIVNVHDEIFGLLKRNGFLYHYQYAEKSFDDRNTCIPYTIFSLQDEEKATEFFLNQIFDKPKMPQMSPKAKNKTLFVYWVKILIIIGEFYYTT